MSYAASSVVPKKRAGLNNLSHHYPDAKIHFKVKFTRLPDVVLVVQSCLTLGTPWTMDHHAPLSMEFSRQVCWSGLPFPSPLTDLSEVNVQEKREESKITTKLLA